MDTFDWVVREGAQLSGKYCASAFVGMQARVFDALHANGTLHTIGDLFAPSVKKVHEFLVSDEGFLGAKYTQFSQYISENPYTFASRSCG